MGAAWGLKRKLSRKIIWIILHLLPALALVELRLKKKKNFETLKSWDIKIIPMTMDNPNIALILLISGWKIQKRYF